MITPIVIPVITIDGPSGTGKGTIAAMTAQHLGWHILDSGSLYRALAWFILDQKVALTDTAAIERVLSHFSTHFTINKMPPPSEIRQESVGLLAARVASIPRVREAMLTPQRACRIAPGLVADGRDMGSVVFPDAMLKFYLDADISVRAARRYRELQAKGNDVSLAGVTADLAARDACDRDRLRVCWSQAGIHIIDTSELDVNGVFTLVARCIKAFYSTPE